MIKLIKNFLVVLVVLSIIQCNGKKKNGDINTSPFIKSLKIIPENPSLGSRISLRIEAGDKEGDDIGYKVKWYLNGSMIGEGFEFYLEQAQRGDRIHAEVIPSDGKLDGDMVKTSVVTIGNTPPTLVSARITPDSILSSTSDLTIIGEGFDPDGDSLSYFCNWRLNNKPVGDSSTTLKLKELQVKKGHTLSGTLIARDDSSSSTPFDIEISVANSPPMLKTEIDSIPYKPENINYPVPIVDPDGDAVTFEVLSAPAGVKIDKSSGVIHGSAGNISSFKVLVRATDSDGAYLDAQFNLAAP